MYQPKFPPLGNDVASLAKYIGDELQAVAQAHGEAVDFVQLNVLTRAPSRKFTGVFMGSGAPTFAAGKGSLYLRSDGSSTSTRAYINTDGSTTWTNLVTAA
jgi:hypothetical protein